MNTVFKIAKKEFKDIFLSPIAYVFIFVYFVLVFGSLYLFSNPFIYGQATIRPFLFWASIWFIFLLPAVTMGRWSDEYKSGTIETLMTLPVKDWQLIAAKFLATVYFLTVILILSLLYPITMGSLGDLDLGAVISGYMGVFLLGCSYLAFGLFVSSLTKNQIIALIVSSLFLFIFYIIGVPEVANYVPSSLVTFFQYVSFNHHLTSMTRGVVDSRDLVFFFGFIVICLYCNQVSLKVKKI